MKPDNGQDSNGAKSVDVFPMCRPGAARQSEDR
jgi:hypothetical protein